MRRVHAAQRAHGAVAGGTTLIELMVAQALGLVLLLALMNVWGGSQASHRHQQSYSAVQESGRIALELMARDLRMAGYAGCGNVRYLHHLSVPTAVPPAPALFHDESTITAIDHAAGTSDVITVTGGGAEKASLSVAMPDAHTLVLATSGALGKLSPGDLLLLSDCTQTEVMRVRSASGATVMIDPPAQSRFEAGTSVMRYQQVQYRAAGGELRRNGTAVVSGVADLQIQYALGGADRAVERYVADPAGAVTDVVAVRLALSLKDGQVARFFGGTVVLRNRER